MAQKCKIAIYVYLHNGLNFLLYLLIYTKATISNTTITTYTRNRRICFRSGSILLIREPPSIFIK